jgi:predicted nucleic acid-binding Zn ribbon protein
MQRIVAILDRLLGQPVGSIFKGQGELLTDFWDSLSVPPSRVKGNSWPTFGTVCRFHLQGSRAILDRLLGQPVGSIFKGQGQFFTDFWDSLSVPSSRVKGNTWSQNVGKELPLYAANIPEERKPQLHRGGNLKSRVESSVVKVDREIEYNVSFCVMRELIGVIFGLRI